MGSAATASPVTTGREIFWGRSVFKFLKVSSIAIAMAAFALPAAAEVEFDFSGYIEPEFRYFVEEASDPRQEGTNFSIAGEIEFEFLLNRDQTIIITPYARLDFRDDERTHFDLRAAYYEVIFDTFELRVGLHKVFWGRTEAAHLIDIINQTDAVDSFDGEEKLGQPMVNVTVPTDFGLFDFYWLPYFRERTFEGTEGRPRPNLVVDTNLTLWEDGAEEEHQDFAARWSHYVGAWDFGIAHFHGTGRDPVLVPTLDKNFNLVLAPLYPQIDQTSVDVQATFGPAAFKFEGFRREQLGEDWFQASGGFEYSIYQVFETDGDLGIVAEYIWDERGEAGFFPFQNDVFGGLRWTANDIQGTSVLAGGIYDLDDNGYALSFEAQRRLGDDFLLSFEGRFFMEVPVTDPIFSVSDDDFLQLRIARYF